MRKLITYLYDNFKIILIAYTLIQISYLLFFLVPYQSDSLYYYNLGELGAKHKIVYPHTSHIYEDYIIAPLFINLQTLILLIYNSKLTIAIFQLCLNFINLYLFFRIVKENNGKEAATIFALIYIFYLPNIGFILLNLTELCFSVFLAISMFGILKKGSWWILLSGFFAAASTAIRPTGYALIGALIIFLFTQHSNIRIKKNILTLSGALLFFCLMGTVSFYSSGKIVLSSVNHGTNLLIGANQDATGAFNARVFEVGKVGFIENPESKTYTEKQNYWFNKGIEWVIENPFEWISLVPSKIVHMFIWDDYAISPLFHMQEWNLYKILKTLLIEKKFDTFLKDVPLTLKIIYILFQICHHIYYFSLIILFIYVFIKKYHVLKGDSFFKLLLLVIGSGIVLPLLTFGDPRFKYPYIVLMMITISPFIRQYFLFPKQIK